jgi:glycosyltransferase involved in cell wall biosynthesis
VIARLNMGGPAHHVSLLSGRLDRTRYETLLVHGSVGEGEDSLQDVAAREGCARRFVPALHPEIHPLRDLRALGALVRIVRHFEPHVVHTHTAKAGMLGRLAALLAGKPRPLIVHTYHGHVLEGYFGRLGSWVYRRFERGLGRFSDRLIGVSEATIDDLVRLKVAPRAKFRLVQIGLDLQRFLALTPGQDAAFRAEAGVRDGEILLTFVGRLVPIKRVDLALEAVALARRQGARVRLAVVGDGHLRPDLEALADQLGIADVVAFLGYRENMVEVTAASDIALLTSDNEGTPVSLIEAAAAATPAISTSVGGVAEVVTPASGLLVEPGDVEGLAAAIVTVAGEAARRREMGERGREHVAERFSVDRLTSDIDALYRDLLEI